MTLVSRRATMQVTAALQQLKGVDVSDDDDNDAKVSCFVWQH
jgi:hypothetical protein